MNDFYVYAYLRSNSTKNGTSGTPYYVGKGRGTRAFNKNRRPRPPADVSNIIFASREMSETDAFQLEILLIHLYGRIDLGTGCLRNITNGGEGQSNPTQGTRRKIREANLGNKNAKGHAVTPTARGLMGGVNKGKKHPPDCKHCAVLKAKWKTVEWREKIRSAAQLSAKTLWQNPDYREKMRLVGQQVTRARWGWEGY